MAPSPDSASPAVATAITITPGSAAVAGGGTVQFSAMAGGMSTSSVTWSVNGTVGGSSTAGTISSGGLYTAPQVSSATLVSVQATLTSSMSSSAVAPVAIMVPGTVSTTHNPQVASYAFNVPEASNVHIEFGPDTTYGLQTWSQSTPSSGGQVKIMVAGMRGFTTYHMRAVVVFPDGTEFNDADHTFATGGLSPSQTPSMTATTTPGMTPSGGVELLDLVHSGSAGPEENVVATDLNGNVIWYFDPGNTTSVANPVKLLPDGNMLINYNGSSGADGEGSLLEEVDLAGDVIWQMNAADLNAALAASGHDITIVGTHHDVAALPNGHLILIASMDKDFTDLSGYPGVTTVRGDVLIDLDQNHAPVWVWSEFDHLDVNRHPMNFPDWTHTNAVLYSASDGDLLISMRHQYWLIKIDYANGKGSGDIVWKLGWQGDFTLEGGTDPVDWFYAQHGPSFLSTNTSGVFQLVLFDNGDNRPKDGAPCGTTPTSPCYSRVPLFQIDETAKTATILWQDTLPIFSFFGGNAEHLANGDVEFDEAASAGTTVAGAVYEVTMDPTAPKTVWQLQIAGQYAYRGFRIPSLYPGVQW
jgi:arylsulfate sulfotransferase